MTTKIVTRKIYTKNQMLHYFYVPTEIPDYLKGIPELLNDDLVNLWCKKPLPKFDEIQIVKQRPNLLGNKLKGRPRTISNQFGDQSSDLEVSGKYKGQNSQIPNQSKNEKFNRYNPLNESQMVNSEVVEDGGEAGWHTVDSKTYKVSNLSKQYVSNYQGQENHWKKWGKDRTVSGGDNNTKLSSPFNRAERTNNFVVRKQEPTSKQDNTKVHSSLSCSISVDQTEDIWQDDWDTEMQSQIAITPHLEHQLDSYQLPPQSASTITVVPHDDNNKYDNNQECNSADNCNLWFYMDLSQKIQGPYHSETMANWLATGYFDFSTSIRRKCDEQFLLLAEYRALYNRIPFTMGPTISPILRDTLIDIDPAQLAAGVDQSILQKVLATATSLSNKNKIPSYITNKVMTLDINNTTATNEMIDKQLLMEEKRKLEESKVELENELRRIQDEQEQWKFRMEKEMEAKFQSLLEQQTKKIDIELLKKVEEPPKEKVNETAVTVTVVSPVTVEEKKDEEVLISSSSMISEKREMKLSLEVDKSSIESEWMSMKDIKNNKKNKKIKNKSSKTSPEPPIVVTTAPPEVKKDETPYKILKESGSLRIIQIETPVESKMPIVATKDFDSLKTEVQSSTTTWNTKPTILNIEPVKFSKSLLEIQAEQLEKEKMKNDIDKVLNQSKIEANKITSFKDSLMKNSVVTSAVKTQVKTPIIPPGKSIWDIQTVKNVSDLIVVVKPVEEKSVPIKKKTQKKPQSDSNNNNNNDDELLNWCVVKLTKFSKELDVDTVADVLKQVPNEDVGELIKELLDDSEFSRTFAKDYVKRRDELSKSGEWQTVKKQTAVIVNNPMVNDNSKKKSKNKKKMVIIDPKFKMAP